MSLGAPGWIVLLSWLLYIHDAGVLLEPDEFMLVPGRGGSWRASFGAFGWTIRGREPWLPNLLLPWRPAYRVRWSLERPWPAADGRAASPPREDGPTRLAMGCLMATIFVVLPPCLFVYHMLWLLMLVAAAIYLGSLVVVLLVARRRDAFGLEAGRMRRMAFECLACPPFALNAVRRASLAPGRCLEPARALALVARAEDTARMRSEMARRVRQALEAEPEGSGRSARLAEAADRLEDR